ncbi:hypothetical protein [Dictyobacter alpinus]|uniref:hypothetical protein n=1 Tax=Dictyobacter alpinus TaxID=2014873 RepID=UPI000F81773E|nr:hypothetical protein [Dictyobacter alpinus]
MTRQLGRSARKSRWESWIVLPAMMIFVILSLCTWWWLRCRGVKISPEIRWYDLWTGVYIRPRKPGETTLHLYWCPIWCIAIHFEYPLQNKQ